MSSAVWHAMVTGRVQGVGFRWFARETARALGLRGWVRNRPDGAVEILAAGDLEGLEQFKARMREGPRGAVVDGARDLDSNEGPAGDSFEIVR